MSVKNCREMKPLVLGHRGYRKFFPENTEIAFRKAFEYGADGIEFDVQKTDDGEFVIFHDYETERLTGVHGNIKEFTRRKHLASRVDGLEEIPNLRDCLQRAPLGKFYNMELKEETITPEDCEDIYNQIADLPVRDCIMVSSFRHDLLPYFKEKGFEIGMLMNRRDTENVFFNLFVRMYKIRPQYLNLPIDLFGRLPGFMNFLILKTFRLLKFKIVFWTVNRRRYYLKVYKYSDAIITDEVEKIKSLRDQYL